MAEKEFFITTVQMIEVEGEQSIPTALLHRPDGSIAIGNEAFAQAGDVRLVNREFKIDLGRFAPGVQSRRRFKTAAGPDKSATQLTDEFLYEVQKIAQRWLATHGIGECKNLVVAEPLSMHTEEVSPEWLANYRANLRQVLEGKRILSPNGVTVRFIPEPFAAFQYYRYGIRHPLVAQKGQMNVLVIDFGGGTCDVCVIETTKDGDISGGGRNKRPLAGKSLPIGGFAINRALAELLLRKVPSGNEPQLKTGLREYRDWLEGKRSIETLDARYRTFIEYFHALVHRLETVKLALSRAVSDWSLSAEQRFSASVTLSRDPFSANAASISVSVSVAELREVFIQKIYLPYLKPFLTERIRLGKELLEGASLTAVLLSGGSANLGWLEEAVSADFADRLDGAPFVRIPDYQLVVAQGLAVDCAREFATGSSDFKGVTYNPLYLLLDPDQTNCEPRPFQSRSDTLPDVRNRPGLLLPTASLLSSFVEKPMHWKVRLNKSPRHRLDYFFLQSSLDPSDITNLQNIEESTVFTPECNDFDKALQVQLTIRTDGTATPRFIYKSGHDGAGEVAKEGRRFCIDMTESAEGVGESYIGLDFGTSNTAISYIDRSWVNLIEHRAKTPGWRELGELVELLPSPLAVALAKYIGDVRDSNPVPPGFSFIEAALCLLAYVTYADFCAIDRRGKTKIFSNFPHRSASYLWHMLRAVVDQTGNKSGFAHPLNRFLDPKGRQTIDQITRQWAETRHEVSAGRPQDLLSAVRLLANMAHAVFCQYQFGFFQGVEKERFAARYSGRFRLAHGKPPYSDFAAYSGTIMYSEAEALVLDLQQGKGLQLSPLVIWYPCENHRDAENGHCFVFDKLIRDKGVDTARFKALGFPCSIEIKAGQEETAELLAQIGNLYTEDPKNEWVSGMRFSVAKG